MAHNDTTRQSRPARVQPGRTSRGRALAAKSVGPDPEPPGSMVDGVTGAEAFCHGDSGEVRSVKEIATYHRPEKKNIELRTVFHL